MKFLIHSNGPTVKTGYGVQTALLADRLAADGHQVAISATFGQPTGLGTWVSPQGHKIPVYPSKYMTSGDDVIHDHARHFFGPDLRDGWIIPLIDVWSLISPLLAEFNVAAWAPVDHDPVPPEVVKFFSRSKARCIAMSRHGEEQFRQVDLDPTYIPLAVDTSVYRPTFHVEMQRDSLIDAVTPQFINERLTPDGRVRVTAREYFKIPEMAFVVGMVGMNKDPNDRKAFVEAFAAFAEFHQSHPNAVLLVHTEALGGAGGLNLPEVANAVGIPRNAMCWTDQYAYLLTQPASAMAMVYTAMDVLLAPSIGEGFCVPLIEAQACGVPVIASNFTAQPELVGAGWTVGGQRWWDQASHSWYQRPNIGEIVDCLEKAYAADLVELQTTAVEFAAQYDADRVYDKHWRPFIASLDERPAPVKPPMRDFDVLIPAMERPQNVERLVRSFQATTSIGHLYYICDADDTAQIAAVEAAGANVIISDRGTSFASKVNCGFSKTSSDWVLVCGDDVEFTPGWVEPVVALSDRYDVIGTNDSEPGRIRNPKVAAGKHADHFFLRRSYVDEVGASLEGPGVLAPEAYFHFYTDMEIIQLAKARGVWSPCLDSRVIHHHPGYDGREDLRAADHAYMKAVEFSEMDQTAFKRRAGLIEQHKVVRQDIWR